MDYEKKYNEALKRARELVAKWTGKNKDFYIEDYSYIFPELRESEDERIRKALIDGVRQIRCKNGITQEQMIAYLEKQKINTEGDFGRGYDCGYEACLNSHGAEWFEKQKEQKEIPLMDGDADLYFDEWNQQNSNPTKRQCFEEGIRYAQRLQKEQKPAEWSEEDADMLNCCISSIEEAKENRYAYKETDGDTSYDREIDWLKSLRPDSYKNCNSRWKPSEEQMEALQRAIDACESEWAYQDDELRSLLNDLNKL